MCYDMKNIPYLMYLMLAITCCTEPYELSLNPFKPNYGITKSDIEFHKFELTTVDCGFCSYTKIYPHGDLNFILDLNEDCDNVQYQYFKIPLDTLPTELLPRDSIQTLLHYEAYPVSYDSNKLRILLRDFQVSAIDTPVKRSEYVESLTFRVINHDKDTFECDIEYWPNGILYLSIESSIEK